METWTFIVVNLDLKMELRSRKLSKKEKMGNLAGETAEDDYKSDDSFHSSDFDNRSESTTTSDDEYESSFVEDDEMDDNSDYVPDDSSDKSEQYFTDSESEGSTSDAS